MKNKILTSFFLISLHFISFSQISNLEYISLNYPSFGSAEFENRFGNLNNDSRIRHPYSKVADDIRNLDKKDFNAMIEFIFNGMLIVWQKTQPFPDNFSLGVARGAEKSINLEFITGNENRAIAYAHSPLQGDTRIIINIDKWEKLNNFQRIWLFTHELGHEYFGLEHGSMKLMYPLMPEEELLLDYYLLKDAPYSTRMAGKYGKWAEKRGNFLKLGKGVIKENLGLLDLSISYAFATLWDAMDEFYSEILDDVTNQMIDDEYKIYSGQNPSEYWRGKKKYKYSQRRYKRENGGYDYIIKY